MSVERCLCFIRFTWGPLYFLPVPLSLQYAIAMLPVTLWITLFLSVLQQQ